MKKVMKFIDGVTGRIGEKLFPHAEEKKRKQYARCLLIALICLVIVGAVRYQAERELRQYQRIADAYMQLDILLDEFDE